MQKYMDTIIVGALAFLVALLMLIFKPGYTPVEVTDEAQALTAGEINFDGEEIGIALDEENEESSEDEETE
jgi:hypothetical protein